MIGSPATGAAPRPPPGILGVTAIVRRNQIGLVGIVLVQRAPGPQRLQQDLPVLHRHRFVELALLRDLGEQLRNMPLKIGLDVADALRLAAERLGAWSRAL